jgi:hypothetical protein
MTSKALSRSDLLAHPEILECTVYRPDPRDSDDEVDLGDARLLLGERVVLPVDWDASERELYLGDANEEDLFDAWLEPESEPGNPKHFAPMQGDYIAATLPDGQIAMYFIHDRPDSSANLYVVHYEEDEL